jgi:hypothetical protein
VDELRAKLEKLQAQYDKIRDEIRALQQDIRKADIESEAHAHLDAMTDDERSVYIHAAAARVGAKS